MRIRKPESHRTGSPFGPAGFTLIELLVVISVILLLAMLLMPTVQMIIRQFYAGRSAVMVRRLHDGALLYKEKTRFLPGEKPDPKVVGSDPRRAMSSGKLTGSQVLAACLFNIEYDELTLDFSDPDNARRIDASKVYTGTFKPEYLLNYPTKPNSISDGFPKGKAKPICYFLASNDPNKKNKVSQFQFTDNWTYLYDQKSNPAVNQTTLQNWVTTRARTPNEVFNNGRFILLAAGLNRKYLVDEVENPDNPGQMMQEADTDDIVNDYGGSTP